MVAGNRRHIASEVKEQLVLMSHRYLVTEIAAMTGVSERTIRRVRRLKWTTGEVVKRADQVGRPRKLNSLDMAVRKESISHAYVLISYF